MIDRTLVDPPITESMTQVTTYADVYAALRSADLVSIRTELNPRTQGRILAGIDGPEHHERRKLEAELFTPRALRTYENDIVAPAVDSYLAERRELRTAEGYCRVDLVDLGMWVLGRVATAIAGIDGGEDDSGLERLLELLEESHRLLGAPEWARMSREEWQRRYEASLGLENQLDEAFYEPSVERRRTLVERARRGEQVELPVDVLTKLMTFGREDWDNDLPRREIKMYLAASMRTTTRALCSAVDEITAWIDDHPEDRPLLKDFMFMRGAVSEALRLHGVLPALMRRAVADVALPSGLTVREGDEVGILFVRANRDATVFGPDADQFDPRRVGRLPAGVPAYGLSFGAGTHMCIGRRLAGASLIDGAPQGTIGTLMTLVTKLYEIGVEPDPDEPALRNAESYYDEYLRYPVRLGGAYMTASEREDEMVGAVVAIDDAACCGYAECVAIAPAIFELRDDGQSRVRVEAVIDMKLARLAVQNCPAGAVRFEDPP